MAALIQTAESYSGYELESVVQGIELTTIGSEKAGDLSTFLLAAEILERILLRIQKPELKAAADTAVALRTLGQLGVAALDLGSERAALAILQVVASAAEEPGGAFQFVRTMQPVLF